MSSPRQRQVEYLVEKWKIPSDEAERLVEKMTPSGPEHLGGGRDE